MLRRLLLVVAGLGLLSLTACDLLERDGKPQSEAEQAVSTARELVPPGTIRSILDLVQLGLGLYAVRKGTQGEKKAEAATKVQATTEAREYNADEGRSMVSAVATDPVALAILKSALAKV